MTLDQLLAIVRDWDFKNTASKVATAHYATIIEQLYYHAAREWRVYLPAEHPDCNSNYMDRLATWIGNLSDEEDQKLLLEYALHISFFSHDDFAALYRTALDREIVKWVAGQVGARLETTGGQGYHDTIYRELHYKTWFCPVTDSMDINEFYKVNHLQGVGHRPAFATLRMLAEKAGAPNLSLMSNIIYYMNNPSDDPNHQLPPLERLVLLEDIVGSGSQCLKTIQWVVTNIGKPVLFVPLILCPNGVDALRVEQVRSNGLLTVRPVIELRRSDLLGPERQKVKGWSLADKVEDLVIRCSGRAADGMPTFGYKNTGCSLVTFSNTPDNTIPIVHNKPKAGGWEPLFPRVYRD